MITNHMPADWEQLEQMVADILQKAGLQVERNRVVTTARGQAAIDVYAVESILGREVVVFCECKHWKAAVPQGVVHSFRTVVSDGGANTGYIISSSDFQSGARSAAEKTNVQLVNWEQFQLEFESSYYEHYFRSKLKEFVDPLCSFTEPLGPAPFLASGKLAEPRLDEFLELKRQYEDFAFLCLCQFPQLHALYEPLRLPLGAQGNPAAQLNIPDHLANIDGYEEFLVAARDFAVEGIRLFRALLRKDT
jgi:hypothetical protein